MKMIKHFTALLALFVFILFMPLTSFAADTIDLDRPSSITIAYKTANTAIRDARFNIYQVATMNKNGVFKITDEFSGININLNGAGESWRNTALALEGYVDIYDIKPLDTAVIDETGYGYFLEESPVIEKGLYLILGQRHFLDGMFYDSEPLLVSLPSQLSAKSSDWAYDIIVNMKFEVFSLEHDQTTDCKVMKVWESDVNGISHPESITVHLISNGEEYDTITLSEENSWKYQWTGLDAYMEWSVYEEFLSDYTVEITEHGETYVVKNTYVPKEVKPTPTPAPNPVPTPPPDKPEIPSFGQLWWPVPVLLVTGLTFVILGLAQRRGSIYEE